MVEAAGVEQVFSIENTQLIDTELAEPARFS
jgi:hypothetical protein